jgi:hypothetical protein
MEAAIYATKRTELTPTDLSAMSYFTHTPKNFEYYKQLDKMMKDQEAPRKLKSRPNEFMS